MKKGNQFYLELQILDENNSLLEVAGVEKVQFNIGELTKEYSDDFKDVTYDEEINAFKIWLTEDETFNFKNNTKMEARVLFKNNVILGTLNEDVYVYDSIKKVKLDVETEIKK